MQSSSIRGTKKDAGNSTANKLINSEGKNISIILAIAIKSMINISEEMSKIKLSLLKLVFAMLLDLIRYLSNDLSNSLFLIK